MHALENYLALRAFHMQNALVAQHAGAVDVDDGAQKVFQLGRIEGAIRPEHEAFHVVVVVVMVAAFRLVRRVVAVFSMHMVVIMAMVLFLQEIRVDLQLGIEIEPAQVEHLGQGHFAKMHRPLRRARVHVFDAVHQRVDLLLGHQVGFADEYLVRETDLAARFLAVVKLAHGVFGIHQRQDGVEQVTLGNLIVHEKCLRHRPRVGQAGGFYDDPVELQFSLAFFFRQVLQGGSQIFANSAADAAVVHLDDLLLDIHDKDIAVDIFFAELVFDHGDLLAVRFGQHAFEQRCFARAEEAGQYGGGDKAHGNSCQLKVDCAALRRPRCCRGIPTKLASLAAPCKWGYLRTTTSPFKYSPSGNWIVMGWSGAPPMRSTMKPSTPASIPAEATILWNRSTLIPPEQE